MRKPDFIIGRSGHPYLNRWWIIPRNRWFNIYLHQILQDDDDRAMHDHPWINCSIILKGAYCEHTPAGSRVRNRGSITFRRSVAIHRLTIVEGPVWSLFITGPVIREWGFWCPQGWRHWKVFVDERDAGQVGRGCD